MKTDLTLSFILKDKERVRLLALGESELDFEVLPDLPPDQDEFIEDTHRAMERLSRDGGEFWEETKQKFMLLVRRVKTKTIHDDV